MVNIHAKLLFLNGLAFHRDIDTLPVEIQETAKKLFDAWDAIKEDDREAIREAEADKVNTLISAKEQ